MVPQLAAHHRSVPVVPPVVAHRAPLPAVEQLHPPLKGRTPSYQTNTSRRSLILEIRHRHRHGQGVPAALPVGRLHGHFVDVVAVRVRRSLVVRGRAQGQLRARQREVVRIRSARRWRTSLGRRRRIARCERDRLAQVLDHAVRRLRGEYRRVVHFVVVRHGHPQGQAVRYDPLASATCDGHLVDVVAVRVCRSLVVRGREERELRPGQRKQRPCPLLPQW